MRKQLTYREALEAASESLDEAEGHALSGVLNIAVAGQYEELGRLYENGEVIEIEPGMFEDTGDANVELVLKLVHEINQVKQTLRNLNGLGNMDE
jgi:hypothetical protein